MQNNRRFIVLLALLLVVAITSVPTLFALDDAPPADIVNDEGGPVAITGSVTYTNAFFTLGVAEPIIILEDQAGFVDRNEYFLMPVESQVIGQITSDFYTSPFTYSLSLPIEPQGSLRDVDNDGEEDTGVMVFAVAYWTNIFGDPFLEERDLFGGGWSSAYASTRVSASADTRGEYVGGTVVIYAPEEGQGFPAGFGDDAMLFTEDDPIVILPQGYTIVNMDTDPFTFDRTRNPVLDLIEGEGAEASDFSNMTYTEAFDALVEKMRLEYAFSEYKNVDWDAIIEEYRPMFEAADASGSNEDYRRALFAFSQAIPDVHIGTSAFVAGDFQTATGGGLGMAIRELDDGRVITNFILPNGPAANEGIDLRAEIISIDGVPIADAITNAFAWSGPFSTPDYARLQQMRYVIRFPVGTDVEVTYRNPGDSEATTATLTTVAETQSFSFSSFNVGLTGFELPLDYEILDSGYLLVTIYSFSDNELLSIQLWERMIQAANSNAVPGIIIDMRRNSGGSGFLADQMAAYFFDEPHELGNSGFYDEDRGEFFFDPRAVDVFYLPSEDLRYYGPVAVLISPACVSACEFFSYDMTIADRSAIVGQYPTAGGGGSVEQVFMPDGEIFQFTIGRAVDANGEIHIEGIGVVPTVRVPVDEDTLFSDGDPILEYAVAYLDEQASGNTIDGGEILLGEPVTGSIEAGQRIRYTFVIPENATYDLLLGDETGQFDTVLYVYDDAGTLLGSNDDRGPDTLNSGFEGVELPAGVTIILEVGTYQDSFSGEYTLSVTISE